MQAGQNETPLFDAVREHIHRTVTPFHVPGHKHGKGLPELVDFFGPNVFLSDLTSVPDMDDLANPTGVLDQAQLLAASAFGVDHAYFLVGGTTSGIHAMILSAVRPGQTILLPRNCHKSVFAALILADAVPVFMPVNFQNTYCVYTTVGTDIVERTLEKHPETAALFLINPSYYGIAGRLRELIALGKGKDASVIVDEAHGSHLYFHPDFPEAGMRAGADACAISMHKTGGSLTQSSFLLLNEGKLTHDLVLSRLNLLRTTSASYLLMVSLDLARKQMALHGKKLLDHALDLARYARNAVNQIDGLSSFGKEITFSDASVADIDETKLVIRVDQIGLTGFEAESILFEKFGIQVELSDSANIMAQITFADRAEDINLLLEALRVLAKDYRKPPNPEPYFMPDIPETVIRPRHAFYARKTIGRLEACAGHIAGEMIVPYPPGIPLVCPGERITRDIIDYINLLKDRNCRFQGTVDPTMDFIRIVD